MTTGGRALVVLLIATAACGSGRGAEPVGPTHEYTRGSGRVELAAGTETDALELELVREASYTEGGDVHVILTGNRGELEFTVRGANEGSSFVGSAVSVRLVHAGREVDDLEGGVCTVAFSELSSLSVTGSASCTGLGTHTGKGYDVGATFELGG